MRKIETVEELKKIQLEIFLSFHQFCTEHHIKYSLAAGSLIGAVRHKGFIPWDDDIDVYLTREEYKKLISLYPSVYQEKYVLLTMERDAKWYRPYGKLYDNRTREVEDSRNIYPQQGISIDVFPIDEVPDDQAEWERYEKKRRLLRDMMTLKSMLYSSKRSLGKNVIMFLGRFLLSPFSFAYIAKRMDRYAQLHNGKGYVHVYENCLGVYNPKHSWLKKDIEEVVEVNFEGHIVHMMKGYDDYLTTVYGDYMQLPGESDRISTHTITCWWKD